MNVIRLSVPIQAHHRFEIMNRKNTRISHRRLGARGNTTPHSPSGFAGARQMNGNLKQLMIRLGWLRLFQKIVAPILDPSSHHENTPAH